MKKISCSAVGGPAGCSYVVEANTEEEALKQWHEHFGGTHPEIVEGADDEAKKAWMEAHHKVWESTADEAGDSMEAPAA